MTENQAPSVAKTNLPDHPCLALVALDYEKFSFVGRNAIRKHVKQDPISTKTLMKYLYLLSNHVEKKSSSE